LIAGSSLGGLFALYAFFERPDLFGAVLAMSPSLWVGRGAAFRHLAGARRGVPGRIYLDAGGRETGGAALRQAEALARLLADRGYAPPRWLMWRPDRRGSHNERAWARRLPKALRFLYS
jgi:predicted alpha/beta superfamily hydrolase